MAEEFQAYRVPEVYFLILAYFVNHLEHSVF